MNPVFHQAAQNTELGWLLGLMTLAFFAFFTAWTVWAYRPANRAHLEACGRIPLDDGPAAGGEA
jgi:cbb3-type cytochrome oxidase subunit 3